MSEAVINELQSDDLVMYCLHGEECLDDVSFALENDAMHLIQDRPKKAIHAFLFLQMSKYVNGLRGIV